jgi:hypothetical protein
MSTYQYYEWQTIDRPLTPQQQSAVDDLSGHIKVTPTRAVVTYKQGEFKHDENEVLAQYFDAHLHFSSFGQRALGFRFPAGAISHDLLTLYLGDVGSFHTQAEPGCLLVSFDFENEYADGWLELDNLLAELSPLRNDLLEGDASVLYLAWLKAITFYTALDSVDQDGNLDPQLDEPGPPVPPGLGALSPALDAFCYFFDIKQALVNAAARFSHPKISMPQPDDADLLARLNQAEKDAYLLRLLQNEPGLSAKLRSELRTSPLLPATEPGPSIGEILRQML